MEDGNAAQPPADRIFLSANSQLCFGLRTAEMNDTLLGERMQLAALLPKDSNISLVLYVAAITMLGNATQVADSKPTWSS